MIADEVRKEGFEVFKAGLVRRLSPTHYGQRLLAPLAGKQSRSNRANGSVTAGAKMNGLFTYLYAKSNKNTVCVPILVLKMARSLIPSRAAV